MRGWASVEGQLMALEAAEVPLAERSVLQADAVFEVLRTYAGKPHALTEHLTRLRGSCERVGLDASGVAAFEAETHDLLRHAGAGPDSEWALRLWLGARGEPGLARPSGGTRRAILATPLPAYDPAQYEGGVQVVTGAGTPTPKATHGAKTTNYLSSIVATTAARRLGAHEVIRLGAHGEVLEGASSNLFVVTAAGGVFTPPLGSGILPGITRQRVLSLAAAAGLEARERLVTCHDLYRAQEVFLTSSIREVMPVVRVDGAAVGEGRPGPVTKRLRAAYQADARA